MKIINTDQLMEFNFWHNREMLISVKHGVIKCCIYFSSSLKMTNYTYIQRALYKDHLFSYSLMQLSNQPMAHGSNANAFRHVDMFETCLSSN